MRRFCPEDAIHRAVFEHLAVRGAFAFHPANGGYHERLDHSQSNRGSTSTNNSRTDLFKQSDYFRPPDKFFGAKRAPDWRSSVQTIE
jgi:hypothetical protein